MSRNVKRNKKGFTLIEVMIVVLIIGILLNIAAPSIVRAREHARAKSCSQNLKRIDSAKQQWAIDNKKTGSATPLDTDLYGNTLYIKGSVQVCPATGYTYTINGIDTEPTCPVGRLLPPYYHTTNGL